MRRPLIADLNAGIGRGGDGAGPGSNTASLPQERHVIAPHGLPPKAEPAIGRGPVQVVGAIGRICVKPVFLRQQRGRLGGTQRRTRKLPPVAGKDRQHRRRGRIGDHHTRHAAKIGRKARDKRQGPVTGHKGQRITLRLGQKPKGGQALPISGFYRAGIQRRRQCVGRQPRRQCELRDTFGRGQA